MAAGCIRAVPAAADAGGVATCGVRCSCVSSAGRDIAAPTCSADSERSASCTCRCRSVARLAPSLSARQPACARPASAAGQRGTAGALAADGSGGSAAAGVSSRVCAGVILGAVPSAPRSPASPIQAGGGCSRTFGPGASPEARASRRCRKPLIRAPGEGTAGGVPAAPRAPLPRTSRRQWQAGVPRPECAGPCVRGPSTGCRQHRTVR